MASSSRTSNVLRLLGAFVITSVVMGLLTAGLVLPAVGAAGQATKKSVSMFDGLPTDFEINPLNQQSRILAIDGSLIATPYDENRIVVPLAKIAPIMRKAQVAVEDKRFYSHGGLDPQGLARAFLTNFVSGRTQGASTLTQQYVKVVLQDQALKKGDKKAAADAISRSGTQGYLRKLQQLKYSVTLEQKLSKDRILEGYLNTVYMGDQQYGVEAAARHFYNVSASQLNVQQAAMLAGVVQRPGATDPVHNPEAALRRRNVVLRLMHEQRMITDQQYNQAKASPLGLNLTRSDQSCASSKYPYYCYYVQDWLLKQPALGKSARERMQKLRAGGLVIQTAMNPQRMAILDKELKAKVPVGNESDVQTSSVQVEPGTGLVIAMGQNTTYSNAGGAGRTSVNYVAPSGGGASAGFQVGSAGKLFAIVEALNRGKKVDSTINVPVMTGKTRSGNPGVVFTRAKFPGRCGLGRTEQWVVGNEHQASPGPMNLSDATGMSINTAFAQLASDIGPCNVRDQWANLGVLGTNGKPIGRAPSDYVLGSANVAVLSMADAYATVAAGGKYCPPRPVVSIKESSGTPLPITVQPCRQVISPQVAAATAKIFHAPFQPGGSAAGYALANGRDAMGKTGTTQGAVSTWFIGSTPQLTTAVWVGRAGAQRPLRDLHLGKKFYKGYIFGGTLAAPMWKSIMDKSLATTPKRPFPPVDPSINGNQPPPTVAPPGATQAAPETAGMPGSEPTAGASGPPVTDGPPQPQGTEQVPAPN